MVDIVLHNKSTKKSDGTEVDAEEKAEYLLKHGYLVPTDDFDELVALIKKAEEKSKNES